MSRNQNGLDVVAAFYSTVITVVVALVVGFLCFLWSDHFDRMVTGTVTDNIAVVIPVKESPTFSQSAKKEVKGLGIDILIPYSEQEKRLVAINKGILGNIGKLEQLEFDNAKERTEEYKSLNAFIKKLEKDLAKQKSSSKKEMERYKESVMSKYALRAKPKVLAITRNTATKPTSENAAAIITLTYTDTYFIPRVEKIYVNSVQEGRDLKLIFEKDKYVITPGDDKYDVLRAWGKPKIKKIEEDYNNEIVVWWKWGEWGKRYKKVRFEDGKVDFWTTDYDDLDCSYKRKIMSANEKEHPSPSKMVSGLNKVEIYKIWGGPASVGTIAGKYNIKTYWYFREKGKHESFRVAIFENSRLKTWFEKPSGNNKWQDGN